MRLKHLIDWALIVLKEAADNRDITYERLAAFYTSLPFLFAANLVRPSKTVTESTLRALAYDMAPIARWNYYVRRNNVDNTVILPLPAAAVPELVAERLRRFATSNDVRRWLRAVSFHKAAEAYDEYFSYGSTNRELIIEPLVALLECYPDGPDTLFITASGNARSALSTTWRLCPFLLPCQTMYIWQLQKFGLFLQYLAQYQGGSDLVPLGLIRQAHAAWRAQKQLSARKTFSLSDVHEYGTPHPRAWHQSVSELADGFAAGDTAAMAYAERLVTERDTMSQLLLSLAAPAQQEDRVADTDQIKDLVQHTHGRRKICLPPTTLVAPRKKGG